MDKNVSRTGNIVAFTLKALLAVLLIGYIFHKYVDVSYLWNDLAQTNLFWVAAAFCFHLLIRWSQAHQMLISVNYYGMGFRLFDIVKIHLVASFYALALPGDIAGGGVTWHLLSRDNGQRAQAASSIVFLRLLNLVSFIPMALFGFFLEPTLKDSPFAIYFLVISVFLIIAILPFTSRTIGSFVESFGVRLIHKLPWRRIHDAYNNLWQSIHLISEMPHKQISGIVWQAFLTQMIAVFLFYCCARAASMDVPFSVFLWIRSVVAIIQLLPLTIAGLGLREFTLILLLQNLYHINAVSATHFSLVIFFTTIVLSGIAGGYFALFGHRHMSETRTV